MASDFKYDAFIIYATVDSGYAKRFYTLLSAADRRVFLDSEALIGGDDWSGEIRQAQEDSLLNVILISNRIDSAYFREEEILNAIDIARKDHRRRVVPVYLMGKREASGIRHSLKQLQGIYWEENSSLLNVVQEIEAAVKATKRQREWLHEIVPETIVIVTGCSHLPEIFDRPSAYELKSSIDNTGKSFNRSFLHSVVVGDLWFCEGDNISSHPNVISIGSAGSNRLTGEIAGQGKLVRKSPDQRWRIVRDANRWALFGDKAEDTYEAVTSFKDRDLPGFLGEVWSQR